MVAIGIDIGGTSIKGAAITTEGKVLDVFSMPVVKGEQQEVTISKLSALINDYLNKHGYNKSNTIGIGIGVPGAIDSVHGICTSSNNLKWNNLPIKKIIEEATGLEVRITNDANAAALGEARFGAGKLYKNIIMITLGTGIGGGIVVNGKLIEGNEGKGAELGHSIIQLEGRQCTCGRRGCFEAYASATALIKDAEEAVNTSECESILRRTYHENGKLDGHVIFEAAKSGDELANKVVDQYVYFLSEGLLNYCNIFRPEVIILSGGIANAGNFLFDKVNKYFENRYYGFRGTPKVLVLGSELGYHSGKIGAAALFLE